MTTRNILIGLAVVLVLAFGVYLYQSRYGGDSAGQPGTIVVTVPPPPAPTSTAPAPRAISIEDFIRGNISNISPVKEQLGGKFYVTALTVGAGKGTVSYEDGHSAYTADFTYESEPETGFIIVKKFVVRPEAR